MNYVPYNYFNSVASHQFVNSNNKSFNVGLALGLGGIMINMLAWKLRDPRLEAIIILFKSVNTFKSMNSCVFHEAGIIPRRLYATYRNSQVTDEHEDEIKYFSWPPQSHDLTSNLRGQH